VIAEIKLRHKQLISITSQFESGKFEYVAGERPWTHVAQVDVALPCATQNEVSKKDAEALIKAGCRFLAEGSNMGSTMDAIAVFETARAKNSALWYGPGKAANCGGVAVSGLEMAQNSQRVKWTSEEVDAKLKDIMIQCFENCVTTAKRYSNEDSDHLPSLVKGANIAGFLKVAHAMVDQGEYW
jgi:glutamate dehydrogenase (NADP+)